jgi:hypothetical protein
MGSLFNTGPPVLVEEVWAEGEDYTAVGVRGNKEESVYAARSSDFSTARGN